MAVCLALIASFSRALAQHPETITVSGLKASVDVLRDTWGINHIYAGNQRDLFFAQGYCAARDRLFQFEIWRRQANGTVAEILGHRGGRNSYTVNSTGPSDNQPIGASFRMIADLSDWDLTVMTNTPGTIRRPQE